MCHCPSTQQPRVHVPELYRLEVLARANLSPSRPRGFIPSSFRQMSHHWPSRSTSYSITLAGATRKYLSVDSASCQSQLSQQAVRILYTRADRPSTERDRRMLPNWCGNNRFVLPSRIIQWCGRWLCIAFMTDVSWPWSPGLTTTRLALRRQLLVLRLLVPPSDSTFYHLLDALSMCFRVHCFILGAVVLLVHVFNIHSFLFKRAW